MWTDVDGKGLAGAGNTVTTTVSDANSGNVTLSGVASAAFMETRELTTAELANGAKDASNDVVVVSVEPSIKRLELQGQAPIDLGLKAGKYSVGDSVTVKNLPANEWSYMHLNQHGARVGWFLADAQGTATFTVPEGTNNGTDSLVVSETRMDSSCPSAPSM